MKGIYKVYYLVEYQANGYDECRRIQKEIENLGIDLKDSEFFDVTFTKGSNYTHGEPCRLAIEICWTSVLANLLEEYKVTPFTVKKFDEEEEKWIDIA